MWVIFSKGHNEKYRLLCVGIRYSLKHHYRKWFFLPIRRS